MNSSEILEIGTNGIWVLLKISIPILMVALIVGLIISLFQALTQIQEMTLSFVPKIIAISLALVFLMPFLGGILTDYSISLFDKIAHIEDSKNE